jgi:hypothetical protein
MSLRISALTEVSLAKTPSVTNQGSTDVMERKLASAPSGAEPE